MQNDWLLKKQEIEKQYDKWLSYNIDYKKDLPQLSASVDNPDKMSLPFIFVERTIACLEDFLKKPLSEASVLDLACMEGVVPLALAKYGVKNVLGIDGRESHIVKAEFARKTFGFQNISFKKEDVRNLNFEAGSFDAVLALGILYHLDAPEVFKFIEDIFKWTKEVAIIDTHFSFHQRVGHDFKGQRYWGIYFEEWTSKSDKSDVESQPESSINNVQSFWLTRVSLFNMLLEAGFTGIYECKYPRGGWRENDDRLTLVVTKMPRKSVDIFCPDDMQHLKKFKEKDFGFLTTHPINRP